MESVTVGRVETEAKFENLRDLWDADQGRIAASESRYVNVQDALVDTGAFMLSLPTSLIRRLGLEKVGMRSIRSSLGIGEAAKYEPVRITIRGRDCIQEVMEVPDGTPFLIGQIVLEQLDFVVDPRAQKLIANPRHDGQFIIEMY